MFFELIAICIDFSFLISSRPILYVQTKLQHNPPTIPLNCTLHSDDTW